MDWPRHVVEATASFERSLGEAVGYYVTQTVPGSASSFLDKYAELCVLLGAFPRHGSPVGDSGLWWRSLGVFTAVYDIDNEIGHVRLLELHYSKSNWRWRVGPGDSHATL